MEEDRDLGLGPLKDADQVFDVARLLMRAREVRGLHFTAPSVKLGLKKARLHANLL